MNAKRTWLRKFACTLPGVGLAGWLAWSSWQAQAQEQGVVAPSTKAYLNKTTINLPILIDDRHRTQLASVHLYVKEGAAQPWKLCDKAAPTQTSFTYRAPQEGEYWFNIVSVDKAGRMTPSDVSKEAPALIVVLDIQAPQVEVQPLYNAPEGQYVRLQCRDTHLDSFKSRLFYQTGDQIWRQLDVQAGKTDTFCIPSQAAWTGNVRALAVDMAGNTTTKEVNLSGQGAAAALPPGLTEAPLPVAAAVPKADLPPQVPLPPVPQLLPASAATPAVPQQVAALPMPTRARDIEISEVALPPMPSSKEPSTPVIDPPAVTTPTASRVNSSTPPAPVVEKTVPVEIIVSQKVAPPAAAPSLFDPTLAGKATPVAGSQEVRTTSLVTRDTSSIQRQFSSSPRLFLDYRIEALGASGVGKVEVWYTRDLGQSWQKLCEDTDRQSPVEVNLPGDGIYGVNLVITNGRGFGGAPPNSGEAPESWIEVDTIKPVASLVQIRAGAGDDNGALHIAWNARDKNLAADSVELQYAATREGPWQLIAKGLKTEGAYRWVAPVEVGAQAFIRLNVRDQANNVASAETPQAIPLDDSSRPRGRVLGISTATPRSASGPVPIAPQ